MKKLRSVLLFCCVALVGTAQAFADQGGSTPLRFTAETPDDAIYAAVRRAGGPKATESSQIAALALIAELDGDASPGVAEKQLEGFAAGGALPAEVRLQASALARSLADDESTNAGVAKARAEGILTDVSVLGPFRDTGGGLDAKDGPETKGQAFWDPKATYSWGTVEVAWRTVPSAFVQARGLPLDLVVHPRKESCTWVASKIKLDAP
ncbi:MAG TPA: hypothetical protein VIF62_20975, partial [Labilithrix sp.]